MVATGRLIDSVDKFTFGHPPLQPRCPEDGYMQISTFLSGTDDGEADP